MLGKTSWEKKIKEIIGDKFPIVFSKNYEDFRKNINNDDFLLFSIVKASNRFKKCQQLVKSFPNNTFHLYFRDDGIISENELDMFLENNVASGQYTYLDVLNALMISTA